MTVFIALKGHLTSLRVNHSAMKYLCMSFRASIHKILCWVNAFELSHQKILTIKHNVHLHDKIKKKSLNIPLNICFCELRKNLLRTQIESESATVNELSVFITKTSMKTYLCNFDPLKPQFYIVKLGFTGVYLFFLIFTQTHRLWVLVRTASARRF